MAPIWPRLWWWVTLLLIAAAAAVVDTAPAELAAAVVVVATADEWAAGELSEWARAAGIAYSCGTVIMLLVEVVLAEMLLLFWFCAEFE